MNRDAFEFALSQYLDGTLPENERPWIEEQLRTDPQAAVILHEYQKLNDLLRGESAPTPIVQWNNFANAISQAIDDHASRPIFTIGRVAMALAASVLIAIGLFAIQRPHENKIAVAPPTEELIVQGPQLAAASGPEEIEVSVGQPQEADAASSYTYDSLVTRRSAVALEGFTPTSTGEIR